jgi:hypothetical protein
MSKPTPFPVFVTTTNKRWITSRFTIADAEMHLGPVFVVSKDVGTTRSFSLFKDFVNAALDALKPENGHWRMNLALRIEDDIQMGHSAAPLLNLAAQALLEYDDVPACVFLCESRTKGDCVDRDETGLLRVRPGTLVVHGGAILFNYKALRVCQSVDHWPDTDVEIGKQVQKAGGHVFRPLWQAFAERKSATACSSHQVRTSVASSVHVASYNPGAPGWRERKRNNPITVHRIALGDYQVKAGPDKYMPREFFEIVWTEENLKSLPLAYSLFRMSPSTPAALRNVSDVARLEALYTMGGLYLDADIEVHPVANDKQRLFWKQIILTEKFTEWEHESARPGLLINSVIKCPAGDRTLAYALELCFAGALKWLELGNPNASCWQMSGVLPWSRALFEASGWTILPGGTFNNGHFTGVPHPTGGHSLADHGYQGTMSFKRPAGAVRPEVAHRTWQHFDHNRLWSPSK